MPVAPLVPTVLPAPARELARPVVRTPEGLVIENLRPQGADEPHNYLGVVTIFGVRHHFQAVEVKLDERSYQVPVHDPHGRFEDLQALYSGAYDTVRLPGLPGTYAICIFPFAE